MKNVERAQRHAALLRHIEKCKEQADDLGLHAIFTLLNAASAVGRNQAQDSEPSAQLDGNGKSH
jgi:hypothetical protein